MGRCRDRAGWCVTKRNGRSMTRVSSSAKLQPKVFGTKVFSTNLFSQALIDWTSVGTTTIATQVLGAHVVANCATLIWRMCMSHVTVGGINPE